MYSSGNIDVRNWVHIFESRCISTCRTKDAQKQKQQINICILFSTEINICIMHIPSVTL